MQSDAAAPSANTGYADARKIAQHTLDLIETYKAPPTPRAYEVLFACATDPSSPVCEAVEVAARKDGVLNSFDIEAIYDAHMREPDKVWEKQDEASQSIEEELDDLLSMIGDHLSANKRFGETLDSANDEISGESSPARLRKIVEMMIAENKVARREAQELNDSLQASQAKLQDMQSNLVSAREEGLRDSLTGLRNRRYFDAALKLEMRRAIANGSALTLCMMDLDHFKQINDKFGHPTGDSVLRMIGKLLLKHFDRTEVSSRYGGEEFAVILPGVDIRTAIANIENLRVDLEGKRLMLSDSRTRLGQITASFGLSVLKATDTPNDLINRADAQLYEAKRNGRNLVYPQIPRAA